MIPFVITFIAFLPMLYVLYGNAPSKPIDEVPAERITALLRASNQADVFEQKKLAKSLSPIDLGILVTRTQILVSPTFITYLPDAALKNGLLYEIELFNYNPYVRQFFWSLISSLVGAAVSWRVALFFPHVGLLFAVGIIYVFIQIGEYLSIEYRKAIIRKVLTYADFDGLEAYFCYLKNHTDYWMNLKHDIDAQLAYIKELGIHKSSAE